MTSDKKQNKGRENGSGAQRKCRKEMPGESHKKLEKEHSMLGSLGGDSPLLCMPLHLADSSFKSHSSAISSKETC